MSLRSIIIYRTPSIVAATRVLDSIIKRIASEPADQATDPAPLENWAAFRPGSGYFGWGVSPTARVIAAEHDQATPADPVPLEKTAAADTHQATDNEVKP